MSSVWAARDRRVARGRIIGGFGIVAVIVFILSVGYFGFSVHFQIWPDPDVPTPAQEIGYWVLALGSLAVSVVVIVVTASHGATVFAVWQSVLTGVLLLVVILSWVPRWPGNADLTSVDDPSDRHPVCFSGSNDCEQYGG
jgi:hypothetical protein